MQKYRTSLIITHWLMALAFVLMLMSGFIMVNLEFNPNLKFQIFQWHKSLGVILLCTFFLRIILRLTKETPKLPKNIKTLEKIAAKLGHYLLYIFMILIPLSGWIMASSSPYGLPTIVFGLFEFPHFPKIAGNELAHLYSNKVHGIFAYCFFVVILLHILAVIKHAIFDKENLLPRMGIGKIKK